MERLVRREGSRRGSRAGALAERPKPGCMSAPHKLSAGPVRSDSIWSLKTERKKAQIPKPANVTLATFERALWTWKKRKRAENVSEEHNQPKPMSCSCEQSNYGKLFTA
nr:putative integron gene cassette protein [uncultured bacterium]